MQDRQLWIALCHEKGSITNDGWETFEGKGAGPAPLHQVLVAVRGFLQARLTTLQTEIEEQPDLIHRRLDLTIILQPAARGEQRRCCNG